MIPHLPKPPVPKRVRGPIWMILASIGMWWFGALGSQQNHWLQAGLWLLGGAVALLAWLIMVAIGWRSGVVATLLLICGVWLTLRVEPALQRQSWRMYLDQHRTDLEVIVRLSKPVRTGQAAGGEGCNAAIRARDCFRLRDAMRHAGVFVVYNDADGTRLWTTTGRDAGGIAYCPGPFLCASTKQRIDGPWYTWWS